MPTKNKAHSKSGTAAVEKAAPKKKTAKVAKKAAKKAPKKQAKKALVYADNTTSFWVRDGQILNSLLALRDALALMQKETYVYHAEGDHNDFANWVEVVLCDDACAAELRAAKTPASAKTVVVRHLKYYAL